MTLEDMSVRYEREHEVSGPKRVANMGIVVDSNERLFEIRCCNHRRERGRSEVVPVGR